MNELRFHRAARIELVEAATYYESQRLGYGQKFEAELDAVVERIAQFPERGTVDGVRWSMPSPIIIAALATGKIASSSVALFVGFAFERCHRPLQAGRSSRLPDASHGASDSCARHVRCNRVAALWK